MRLRISNTVGAALTEKLLVMLMGVMLIVPAIMIFGPILVEKVALLNELIGGTPRVETLAERPNADPVSGPPWTGIIFAIFLGAFFVVFITPLLFPRARKARQEFINRWAERVPGLEALADTKPSRNAELAELRGIARELKSEQARAESALELKTPSADEETVSRKTSPRSASPAPNPAQPYPKSRQSSVDEDATLVESKKRIPQNHGAVLDEPATDDASLLTSLPADHFPGRRVSQSSGQDAKETFSDPHASAPRQGKAHDAPGRLDPPKTGKIVLGDSTPGFEPDAETLPRPALDRRLLDPQETGDRTQEYDPWLPTPVDEALASDDPDATTKPHQAFNFED